MAADRKLLNVIFPRGGVNRRGGYAQSRGPFTCPGGFNVRSIGPLEERDRGGNRPGLVKFVDNDFGSVITGLRAVGYIDASGNLQHDLAVIADGSLSIIQGSSVTTTKAYLATEDGDRIIDEDGNYIIFNSTVASVNPIGDSNAFQMAEWEGKLYIADSTLKVYDPVTGVVQDVEGAPSSQPLVCVYQERLLLAGEDHMFYMAGEADGTDWVAGADGGKVGRAVFGYVGDSGAIGEKILAVVPWHDRALVFGTIDSLWAVYGNPAREGSEKKNVSPHVGIISPRSICVTPNGMVLFLARNGLYAWQVGSQAHPEPFSKRKVPEELLDVDASTTDVMMQYDHRSQGVHLFLTPSSGVGTHWWIDLENKALWPMKLTEDHQPLAAEIISISGYSNVVLGCKDGYLRRFSNTVATDDGEALHSHLLLGPFHIGREEGYDGIIAELNSALAVGSGDVKYKLITADSAEEAVDLANNQLDAMVDSQY